MVNTVNTSPEGTETTEEARRNRWCEAFGSFENNIMVYNDLCTRMSSEGRYYHTMDHIDELLALAEAANITDKWFHAAIWFHDAVYHPGAKNNEEFSARLAGKAMPVLGMEGDEQAKTMAAIRATRTHKTHDKDIQLFLDADMAILGAGRERYKRYAADIRQEFSHIGDWRYGLGRRRFLKSCLKRKAIFLTPWFNRKFEAMARANIQAELKGF
ncbi:metal-dependent phosphohydrolase [Kordiimonas sp.]|uniref:HD domain-containing protein n=1 Tax=Kordiimonas sp. TaxID=1970157 RepID=UPI003A9085CD